MRGAIGRPTNAESPHAIETDYHRVGVRRYAVAGRGLDVHVIGRVRLHPCIRLQRSNLAGWAGYGYCASHSRFFWGLRLYLVCTPSGLPILWALASPKIGEREVLAALLDIDAGLVAEREGILLISDKGFAGRPFEKDLAGQGVQLLRPSRKREEARYGELMLKKIRQLIQSVNDTLKGHLDLEQHGGRTFEGVAIRVAQRILAMAAAIWHNRKTGAPAARSLLTYGH